MQSGPVALALPGPRGPLQEPDFVYYNNFIDFQEILLVFIAPGKLWCDLIHLGTQIEADTCHY